MSALLLAAALQGFGGRMSAFEPAGPQAGRIHALTWFLVVTATLVTLAVVAAALYGALHRRRRVPPDVPPGAVEQHEQGRQRTAARWVAGAVVASAAIILLFLVVDFGTGRAMAALPRSADTLTIHVTGHQWWWEVRYDHPVPSRSLTTANEIHVPVGRPVVLRLTSTDVIHSIWAPNLHGKKDLVPGHETITWFQADTAGVYRGQCAEYCGHQHAKMGFLIVAQPPERFAEWYERQLQPAAAPADSVRRAGERIFLAKGCVLCHAIRGTPAGSRMGPDLTHLGSRRTLAAGTLPNTRGHLAGWIVDPQRVKPGVRMPPNALAPDELEALLHYLEGLK